jgi:hypothetical protein
MPSSKKASSPARRASRRTATPRKPVAHRKPAARRKPAAGHKRTAVRRSSVQTEVVVLNTMDPLAATQPAFALSTVAAVELESFAKLLKSCKRVVGTFTDDQRDKLRTILGRAHRALEQL